MNGKGKFNSSDQSFYKFQSDRTDIPLNMTIIHSGEPRKALIISSDLVKCMGEILNEFYGFSEEDNDYLFNMTELLKSDKYQTYNAVAAEL